MVAQRNGLPLNLGSIAIQPAISSQAATQPPTALISGIASTATTANFPPSITRLSPTVLTPVVPLLRTPNPFISSPVIFTPKPAPIKKLTEKDMQEETLSLDTHTFVNGQAVLDVSSLRCEFISMLDFRPMFATDGASITVFGRYMDDLYQSSAIRDTLRKYLLLNKSITTPQFNNVLSSISLRVNGDIINVSNTIKTFDALLGKIKEINNVLDLKNNMDASYVFKTPYQGLRNFVTQRMLFSEQAYNIFSDTKVLYQLLFDLGGILEKCSFNLIDGFTDSERSAYVSDPKTIRKQTIQDSITLDLTYGDNLRYTPDAIRSKYISDYITFNSVLNVLPASSTNRFKFLINLLSKELRVSKGLGKYKLPEAGFFGFLDRGNPFDNVIGSVPSDVFIAPLGQNSLSTLFYLKTGTQNAVILPFESRQVAGDGETVFVPGTTYFSDGILNGDFSTYFSYREAFSDRVAKARTVFNKLLLDPVQTNNDPDSAALGTTAILKSCLGLYASSQALIKKENNDPTNLLSFVLLLIGNSKASIKFEIYKLLLLVALYDTRQTVGIETTQTDPFRDLLFRELASQPIQGFSALITEANIPTLLDNQIEVVKQLLLNNITPLPQANLKAVAGLSRNQSAVLQRTEQLAQLGRPTPSPPPQHRNPNSNTAQVQVQQFSRLIYSLRGEHNLFKNVLDLAKQLFSAASSNDTLYHLVDGSSSTRYHGLTLSGYILLVFETFSALVDQFANRNISYNLVDGAGAKQKSSQYIQISFVGNELDQTVHDMQSYVKAAPYTNTIISDYDTKLRQEDQIVDNIIMFFEQLKDRMTNIAAPSLNETALMTALGTDNPNSLSTTRTAKGILQGIINKKNTYNPDSNMSLDFYLPSGKAVSERNWTAVVQAMRDGRFISSGSRKKLATVGIPYGFVKSALGARLSKSEVYNGKLQEDATDLISVNVYKLDKNDEGLIYKPQTFRFDLSLFARGFDAYDVKVLKAANFASLSTMFQLYDFDEDEPFSRVVAKTVEQYIADDPYYSASEERMALGREAGFNLYQSFLLDLYHHMLTGLNTSEETFISYTQEETATFTKEMKNMALGTADLTKIKFMSPEYRDLLKAFSGNRDDTELMLTLCNDIPKTVLRQKDYDRTFNILFDVDKFEIDTNAMGQTTEGQQQLELLHSTNRTFTDIDGGQYKVAEPFLLDEYFINVELVR